MNTLMTRNFDEIFDSMLLGFGAPMNIRFNTAKTKDLMPSCWSPWEVEYEDSTEKKKMGYKCVCRTVGINPEDVNVTMEDYPGDLYDDLILFFKETYGVIDTRVHSFMHNYLTLSYLNDINELYDVMAMIKTYKYPKHVTKKDEEIVKSLVESDGTYKDRYIIDTIKTR